MSTLARNGLILLVVLVLAIWAIYPPDKKLRKGKDIAGGVTLVYGVDIKPTDPPDTLGKVASVLKERLDPNGVYEISVVPVGGDRIEITMPLPTEDVKKLKDDFEKALALVGTTTLTKDQLERIAVMPEPQRTDALKPFSGGDADRAAKISKAVQDFEALRKARADYEPVKKGIDFIHDQIRNAGGDSSSDPVVKALQERLKVEDDKAADLRRAAASAEIAYEKSSKDAVSIGLNPADLRRALTLSNKPYKLPDKEGKIHELQSPRQRAIDQITASFPAQKPAIEAAIAKWDIYEKERGGLDDPQDVIRILKGAGVLDFRIAVRPGELTNERDLLAQLKQGGPRAVKSDDARFYRVNKIEQWADSVEQLDALKTSATAFFANRGLIADEYKGDYYVLLWDKRESRLTHAPEDGAWQLSKAYQGADQLGRPAIDFEMDILGADKLGRLTGNNVGRQMAVLLDDEVYTAPTLQSKISSRGQITGSFSQSEIDYIVRVLSAGSLKAKLSPEPIGSSVVGPSLGAENLNSAFKTGIVAFAMVAAFMIVYYFGSGFIAVIALAFNFILVLAMMAINQSAFTIPGIAGVVLTFGQAVDANVLIYERIREELHLGHDLRTSVRLGFSRALSPIVDGNVSNLIICVVLGFFGTEDIRGFAITLGIGVVTTLFATLFFTRWVFNVLIEKFGWRKASQLPIAVPFVQRLFSPHVDWMRLRHVLLGLLVVFLIGMGFVTITRWDKLLGMEFRGGTAVTLTFKQVAGPDGKPVQLTKERTEVDQIVKSIATKAPAGSPLRELDQAQVIAVNPDTSTGKSSTFTVRSKVTDVNAVQEAITGAFVQWLDVRQPLKFTGSDLNSDRAPVFAITAPTVGEVVEKPGKGGSAADYQEGVAILLDNIDPPTPLAELQKRLTETRQKHDFADISSRPWEVRVLDGSDAAATSAVILVRDPDITLSARNQWESEVRDREWKLVQAALTRSEMLASVQSFSSAIAKTFATQGLVCTVLSLVLLTIYVFVRFGTVRWAIAATVPLFADVIGIIGLLGLAQMLYEANPEMARKFGLLPFDLDLPQVAAILTIVGYSLNDKIIILDRIRENKGKLPYASYEVINNSINQTLSRTVITAGAHMITTIVLYIYGGEAVRGFAYTFNLGVLLGTYTSIVSTPLVWSHKHEGPTTPGTGSLRFGDSEPGSLHASNGERTSDISRPAASA